MKEIVLGIAQIEELSVSQEVCCHIGSKHPGVDNILTKQAVLIHKASCCHNSKYTSSYPYHHQDARHSLLLLYILHCLGSGTSCPSGSNSDCRNVFPFISFVVAITNSTSAAKGGKEYNCQYLDKILIKLLATFLKALLNPIPVLGVMLCISNDLLPNTTVCGSDNPI